MLRVDIDPRSVPRGADARGDRPQLLGVPKPDVEDAVSRLDANTLQQNLRRPASFLLGYALRPLGSLGAIRYGF